MIAGWRGWMTGKAKVFFEIVWGRMGFRDDFVGYEILLAHFEAEGLGDVPGEIVEIGAFLGGGTRKLCQLAKKFGKQVHVIDIFDPCHDRSKNDRGESMSWIYRSILGNRNLKKEFENNTRDFDNLIVHQCDSRDAHLGDVKVCFAFVDGGHSNEVVKSDFNLLWSRLSPRGVIAFHDYGGDLPQVKEALDGCILDFSDKIESVIIVEDKKMIFIRSH